MGLWNLGTQILQQIYLYFMIIKQKYIYTTVCKASSVWDYMQDFLPDPVSIPYHNLTPIWLECVQPVGTCSEVPKVLANWYQYEHPQAIGN